MPYVWSSALRNATVINIQMVHLQFLSMSCGEQEQDSGTFRHWRVNLLGVVVESALMPETEDTTARPHLANRTVSIGFDL